MFRAAILCGITVNKINFIDFQAHMNCTDIQLMSVSVSQRDGVRGLPRKNV